MAGARKDVELIIRARDEAAKAVSSVTKAVNQLVTSQDELERGAEKSDTALTRLGKALAGLDKNLRGLSLNDTLTRDLGKATEAASRLEKGLGDIASEGARLAKELTEAAAATERLTAETAQANRTVDQQAAALARAKNGQKELTEALRAATTERDKLATADARLVKQIAAQEGRLTSAKARFDALSKSIAETAQPTATLQARLEAARTSLSKNETRLESLKTQYGETQSAIKSTGEAVTGLTSRLDRANAEVTEQAAKLEAAKTNYLELGAAAKAAATNQRALGAAAESNADALAKQQAALDRAQTEMGQLATAGEGARAALAGLAASARGPLLQAFGQQVSVLRSLREEQDKAQAAIRTLGAEIGRVGVPTKAMVEAFNASREAARAAKAEYAQQQGVLQQMRTALRSSATDIEALASRQRMFSQAQTGSAAALERVRSLSTAAASSQRQLAAATAASAASMGNVAQQVNKAATDTKKAAGATDKLAAAYQNLYGKSRQAMSITQRLRGEVISLITTYSGLYGVINLLGQTVGAYQSLEAAQSRLNVAFDGDQTQVAAELDFIRRNAERLGIQFGSLVDEYTKFAIATKNSNLEGQNTRDIFVSVAEAGRVAKLSFEDMKGIFKALTQIVSKGRVQLEELSGQLGDRLPGALQIMADGLGITVQALTDLTRKGEVSSDALVGFANRLDEVYGAQLAAALKTTTTNLGGLQNAAFQALLAFGQQGFIKSFNDLLMTTISTMQSADFESFIGKLSKFVAFLTDILSVAVDNWGLLVIAAVAFTGVKLIPFVGALVGSFRNLVYTMRGAAIMSATAGSGLAAFGATAAVATTSVSRLTLAFRALMSSTGIGLIVTAISVGLGLWATQADSATVALTAHEKIVDAVKNAYDAAGGSAEEWGKKIAKVSLTQAQTSLVALRAELQKFRDATQIPVDITGAGGGYAKGLAMLVKLFKEGTVDAQKLKTEVDALAQRDPNFNRGLAQQLLDMADSAIEAEKRVAEAEAIIRIIEGTATEADKAILGLGKSVGEVGDNFEDRAVAGAAAFRDELEKLNKLIPEIGQNLDLMKAKAELDDAFKSAARAATTMSELAEAVRVAGVAFEGLVSNEAIAGMSGATNGASATAALLRQFEGFIATPKADNDGTLRIGFGSDTITLSDGTIKQVVDGMRISVEDANRDLTRRVGDFLDVVKDQVGADRFNTFSKEQQAALGSIAYNYGALPDRILDAVRNGSAAEIAASVRALQNDNGGINRERRLTEAGILGREGVDVEGQVKDAETKAEKLAEEAKKRADEAAKFHAEQEASLALQQVEIDNANKGLVQREIAKALADAENAAKAAGTVLSEEERATIVAQVTALNEKKAAEEANNAVKEKAQAAEQKVNDLLAQRVALEEQMKILQESGQFGQSAEIAVAIGGINTQLQAAITNAILMWQAVGGPGADAAIAKLRTMNLETANLANSAMTVKINWDSVAQTFASGLTSAIFEFADAVAAGADASQAAADAFAKFASDFLRKIAEMIIQQLILNAISGMFGGGGGGGGGLLAGLFGTGHTGGTVGQSRIGSGNGTRRLNPMIFARAPRFHEGGGPGLRPGEVPAVLMEGEEVLTRTDPRHILNGGTQGGEGAGTRALTIVNAFDEAEVVSAGLSSRSGTETLLNVIRGHRREIKEMLG